MKCKMQNEMRRRNEMRWDEMQDKKDGKRKEVRRDGKR
jgi:hypothetical protein